MHRIVSHQRLRNRNDPSSCPSDPYIQSGGIMGHLAVCQPEEMIQ